MPIDITPISTETITSIPGLTTFIKKKPKYIGLSPIRTTSTISTITDPFNATSVPVVITTESPYLSPSVKWPKKWTEPITLTFYDDLNLHPEVQKRISKHIYYKLLDKWLYEDMIDVLNYFKIVDGRVKLISSLKDYDPLRVEKDTTQTVEKKTDYIQENVFFRSDIEKLLRKYVKETKTNWYDIPNNTYFIKKIIKDELIKRIKNLIAEKKSD